MKNFAHTSSSCSSSLLLVVAVVVELVDFLLLEDLCGGECEGGRFIFGLIGGVGVGVGVGLVTFDGVPVDVGGVVLVGGGVAPDVFVVVVVVVDVVFVGFVGGGDFGLSSKLPCETNTSFM